MSLREAASRAGLSASFIGLVERGETEIAISRLIRLADAYGAVVAELLADVHEPRVEFVSAQQALQVDTHVVGVEILYLASPSWSMEPFLVRLEPEARLTGLSHASEEFIHCTDGHPTLVVAQLEFVMLPGDTLCIPPMAEHAYLNDSSARAVLIGAVQRLERENRETEPIWRQAVRDASLSARVADATGDPNRAPAHSQGDSTKS